MPAIERNTENRARLPFEGYARTGVVPDRGRAAPVQDVDHLLEQLPVRIELAARRDLADIAIVAGARSIVVEKDRAAATARPGLEVDGAQVADVVGAPHLQPLLAHPAQIGGVLLGLELLRQLIGHDRIRPLCRLVAHLSCAHFSCSMMARSPSTTSADILRSSATIFKIPSGGNGSTSRPRRADSALNSGSCTIRANACRRIATRSGAVPGGARNDRPISDALAPSRMMFLPRASGASSTTVGESGALGLRASPMVNSMRARFLSSQPLPLTYSKEAEPEPWISRRSTASPISAADL